MQPATSCSSPSSCQVLLLTSIVQQQAAAPCNPFKLPVSGQWPHASKLLKRSLSQGVLCCGDRRRLGTARVLLAIQTAWQPRSLQMQTIC